MAGIREEKKRRTRQAILEAGMRLFVRKGYENTSITDLASEAGIGKGTVYTYFKTKREIFLAYCEEELEFINREVAATTGEDDSFFDCMLAVFIGSFRFFRRNKEFCRILMRESFFPSDINLEQSRKIDELYINMLIPILKRGQERGELRRDLELTLVIGHFYGMFIMTMSAWCTDRLRTESDVTMALSSLFEQALQGMAPQVQVEQVEN